MQSISDFLAPAEGFCVGDYVPVVSTVTNLIYLFQKCVMLPFMSEESINSSHYYTHINEKPLLRCVVLIIPVLGNIIVGIYDFSNKKDNANVQVNGSNNGGSSTSNSLQDPSLEDIVNMNDDQFSNLFKDIKVNNRTDYIKWMLIHAIKGERQGMGVDVAFHDMLKHFKPEEWGKELKPFVLEDIEAGRKNQEDTLLHEILKCEHISAKSKGQAFDFILRDGHDHLRDYMGKRIISKNSYGNDVSTFELNIWGDSLKKIFDSFSSEEKKEFFKETGDQTKNFLQQFTGIKPE